MFDAPEPAARCGESTWLAYTELEFFFCITSTPWRRPDRQPCALQQGHAGPHTALIAQHERQGDSPWWLYWDATGHHWAKATRCLAHRTAHPDQDACQLPAGHHGQHSWLLDTGPQPATPVA